jgi:hypothetical protein
MFLPKLFAGAALAAALLPTAAAQAAPPWSDPVTVPGSSGQASADPHVLFTRTRGGAVAFNGVGAASERPVLRSLLADNGPLAATPWTGAQAFDTTNGSFAAADRIIYAGSDGNERVNVAIAPGPESDWRTERRGPTTGGARVATAAAPKHTAAAFSTFGAGEIGAVYLVRQSGTAAPSATQRISANGHIRSVTVAVNAAGDVLTAWDRDGKLEARLWYGASRRLAAVQELGTTKTAAHISAALGSDRRATVTWIDQSISSEGGEGQATVKAVARSASRGFLLPAKTLEAFSDDTLPGGRVIRAAYTGTGRGVIAWSGRNAVRAAVVDGRLVRAAADLAPIAPDENRVELGLGDLAVSPAGQAVVTMVAPVDASRTQILAAPLSDGAPAFGPPEPVSPPEVGAHVPSSGFDFKTNRITVAWQVPPTPSEPNRIELATRPTP